MNQNRTKANALLLLVVGASLLLFLAYPHSAIAASPSQITPGANVGTADYQFALLGNNPPTYVRFGANFYSDDVSVFGDHANFTNIALGSAANPTNTFDVGVRSGNATISSINSNDVLVTVSCTAGNTCYTYYYYVSGTPVTSVVTNNGGVTATVQQAAFLTSFTTFTNAAAPEVFWNGTGNYVETKTSYANPLTVDFYINGGSSSGGGGTLPPTSGGGGGSSSSSSTVVNPPTGSSLSLKIDDINVDVRVGEPTRGTIKVGWQGATKIIITDIVFTKHPEWFHLEQALPMAAVISASDGTAMAKIPFTVTVPADFQGPNESLEVYVTAITGSTKITEYTPVTVNVAVSNELALYAGAGIMVTAIAGYAIRKRRHR